METPKYKRPNPSWVNLQISQAVRAHADPTTGSSLDSRTIALVFEVLWLRYELEEERSKPEPTTETDRFRRVESALIHIASSTDLSLSTSKEIEQILAGKKLPLKSCTKKPNPIEEKE